MPATLQHENRVVLANYAYSYVLFEISNNGIEPIRPKTELPMFEFNSDRREEDVACD